MHDTGPVVTHQLPVRVGDYAYARPRDARADQLQHEYRGIITYVRPSPSDDLADVLLAVTFDDTPPHVPAEQDFYLNHVRLTRHNTLGRTPALHEDFRCFATYRDLIHALTEPTYWHTDWPVSTLAESEDLVRALAPYTVLGYSREVRGPDWIQVGVVTLHEPDLPAWITS